MPSWNSGRRRAIPRIRRGRNGLSFGMGPIVTDHVSGRPIPLSETVPQRGGRVSSRWGDETRDRPEPSGRVILAPAQPVLPDPLYRLLASAAYRLTLDEEERDDEVDAASERWALMGYAYPGGDEESGLTLLRRLFNSTNGDYFHTISSDEVAAALVNGYVEQTPSVPIYVFSSAGTARNRIPIHRSQHSTGRHFYAVNFDEIRILGATWRYEGEVYYILRGRERTVT